jgi:hypothetical protein
MEKNKNSVENTTEIQQPESKNLAPSVQKTIDSVRNRVDGVVEFSLERNDKGKDRGVIEKTVGHIGGTLSQLLYYTTPEAIFKNTPREKLFDELTKAVADVPFEHKGVLIRLGHVPFWGELKRLFQKEIEHRPNILLRVLLGIPTVAGMYLSGKIARTDMYNPFTRTGTVYHPDKAVGMHQLGAAYFYDQKKYPGLWAIIGSLPGFQHYKEYQKSNTAMKMETDPGERQRMAEVLQPMYSYLITQYIPTGIWLPPVGAWATKLFTRSQKLNGFFEKDEKTFAEEKREARKF